MGGEPNGREGLDEYSPRNDQSNAKHKLREPMCVELTLEMQQATDKPTNNT